MVYQTERLLEVQVPKVSHGQTYRQSQEAALGSAARHLFASCRDCSTACHNPQTRLQLLRPPRCHHPHTLGLGVPINLRQNSPEAAPIRRLLSLPHRQALSLGVDSGDFGPCPVSSRHATQFLQDSCFPNPRDHASRRCAEYHTSLRCRSGEYAWKSRGCPSSCAALTDRYTRTNQHAGLAS